MFIHWGVYSVPAGTYQGKKIGGIGEWIMNNGRIPVAEYAGYAKEFNPTKFDADEWVETAQAAGMKYMVITAKHHDGFAMFHTKVDGYNIYDATPFNRDPLAELAAACRKHGMKLGFYYSQCQDWHHPGGEALHGGHWDKAQDGDFDEYLNDVAIPQVKELLTNYGPVSVLWFDTPTKLMTRQRAAEFLPLLDLQPRIIVNNRLGGGFKGDTETPEQHIPPRGYPGRDWETCMTINDTWGYKSYDANFKSTQTLLLQSGGHRQQGRELSAERWANERGDHSAAGGGSDQGDRGLAENQRRVDLRIRADGLRTGGGEFRSGEKGQERQAGRGWRSGIALHDQTGKAVHPFIQVARREIRIERREGNGEQGVHAGRSATGRIGRAAERGSGFGGIARKSPDAIDSVLVLEER